MKKLIGFILAISVLLIMSAVTVSAEKIDSGTCGENLIWELDDSGILTINGTGDMEDYYFDVHSPWYNNERIKVLYLLKV